MSPSVPNGVSVGGVGAISNVQMNEDPRKRSLSKSSSAREPIPRKSIDTFGQRASQYRGVTRHRWTGRYEAHLIWIRNIEQHASDNVNKILVGNKADMDESKRAVPTSKGQALADEYGIKFFETSAKQT
ncbi:hypothetical protein RYX36_031999 [Vicia faba]